MTDHRELVLRRLAASPATLAELRAALPADDPAAAALPSMGEPDPFGAELTAMVEAGDVEDRDGRFVALR